MEREMDKFFDLDDTGDDEPAPEETALHVEVVPQPSEEVFGEADLEDLERIEELEEEEEAGGEPVYE